MIEFDAVTRSVLAVDGAVPGKDFVQTLKKLDLSEVSISCWENKLVLILEASVQ